MKFSRDSSQHPERGEQLGIISDLARLRVRDADMASRIQPARREDLSSAPDQAWPEQRAFVAGRPIKVYLAEERPVLRAGYQTFLSDQDGIELKGSSDGLGAAPLLELGPDVIIVGVKALREDTVDELSTLRRARPDLGLVVLFARYKASGIDALRGFFSDTSVGFACLQDRTVDAAAQLARIVRAVALGRFVMDPRVMAEITEADDALGAPLGRLSPEDLELLGLIAKAIAAGS